MDLFCIFYPGVNLNPSWEGKRETEGGRGLGRERQGRKVRTGEGREQKGREEKGRERKRRENRDPV